MIAAALFEFDFICLQTLSKQSKAGGGSQTSLQVPSSGASSEYLAPCKGTPPPSYKTAMENLRNKEAVTAAAGAGDEDAYFMPISDDQAGLLQGSGNVGEGGVVNTSFEDDNTYLAPRKIESDHESDEEMPSKRPNGPSQYLSMTNGSKSSTQPPQILVSDADDDDTSKSKEIPQTDAAKELARSEDSPKTNADSNLRNSSVLPAIRGTEGSGGVAQREADTGASEESELLPSMYITTSSPTPPSDLPPAPAPPPPLLEEPAERTEKKLTRQPAEHSEEETEEVEEIRKERTREATQHEEAEDTTNS